MIRKAKIADFDAVEAMLHDFHAEKASQFSAELYDRHHFRHVFRGLLSSDRGLVAVIEEDGEVVGCMISAIGETPFAPILVAEEIMWWVKPESRGPESLKMLDVYEAWAAGMGAKIVGLSFFGKRAPAEYKKRGFSPVEQKFAKAL